MADTAFIRSARRRSSVAWWSAIAFRTLSGSWKRMSHSVSGFVK
jgi:hypothetical protein